MKKVILIIFLIAVSIGQSKAQCFANATLTGNNCDTNCTGGVFIQFTGGQIPYSLSLNGGVPVGVTSSSYQFGGLCPGTYTFLAIDALGDTCTGSNVFVINQSTPLILSVNVFNATCIGCNDGSATINVSGGTSPYSYLWSNGTTTQTIGNLSAGTYTVYVTDANGCSNQISFNIGVGNNGFYTLTGEVYFDLNSNGIKDVGEQGLANQDVTIQPNNITALTNFNGSFLVVVPPGNYDVSYQNSPGWNLTSLPSTYNVNVSLASVSGLDFGIYPDSTAGSANMIIYSGQPRCVNNVYYHPSVFNNGFTILDGTVAFTIDPTQTYISSSVTPVSVFGNTITIAFSNLAPGQSFNPYITVLEPVAGLTVTTSAILAATDVFSNLINDTTQLNQLVTCSYDPNDKSVQPFGVGAQNYVAMDEWLTYQIRFQNTGNDTAFKVVVIDTLNLNLDINSFSVIASSHPVVTNINPSREIAFTFDNILLPDSNVNEPASHGYIVYRVKGLNSNPDPSTVNNTAYIYFDSNNAVVTNTTLTTFSNNLLGIYEVGNAIDLFTIFPNPMHQSAEIKLKDGITGNYTISLLDITGRKIADLGILNNSGFTFKNTGLSAGTYILKISGSTTSFLRIVIQ